MNPPDSLVVRRGGRSVLVPRRSALAGTALAVVLAAVIVLSCSVGSLGISPARSLTALLGLADRAEVHVVQQVRFPRVLAGALAGAAFGAAGCLTQTLARNRLATPEIMGVQGGATVGVVISLLGTTAGTLGAWWAGTAGAVAVAVVIVLLAGGLGTRGYRVLIVGLGVSITVAAVTDLVLASLPVHDAEGLFAWSIGSMAGAGHERAVPVAAGLAVLLPVAVVAGRWLSLLRFEEDVAASLGRSPSAIKALALVLAVLLAGLAVAVGGPIGLLSLAAPVIAARLTGPARVPVVCSALVGAILLALADLAGRTVAGTEVPVGVLTGLLGGPFLLWVLLTDDRARA